MGRDRPWGGLSLFLGGLVWRLGLVELPLWRVTKTEVIMKSKLFVLGAASLLLASCSNELDVPVNQVVVGGRLSENPLSLD